MEDSETEDDSEYEVDATNTKVTKAQSRNALPPLLTHASDLQDNLDSNEDDSARSVTLVGSPVSNKSKPAEDSETESEDDDSVDA